MYDRRSFWERLRDFLIVLVLSLVILGVSFGAAVGAIWLGRLQLLQRQLACCLRDRARLGRAAAMDAEIVRWATA